MNNKMKLVLTAVIAICLPVKMFALDAQSGTSDIYAKFPASETWFLNTGTEIKATIRNAIFSYNLQTPIIAVVDVDASCTKNGYAVLPKGTRLLGTADILKSDDRVNIRFSVAVLPNGREFAISGLALSPDGSAGVKGTVKEYKDLRVMSSAASGALLGVGQAVALTAAGQPIISGAISGALQQGAQEAQHLVSRKWMFRYGSPFQKTLVFSPNDSCLKPSQRTKPMK